MLFPNLTLPESRGLQRCFNIISFVRNKSEGSRGAHKMKIVYLSASSIPSRTANSIHVMRMCAAFAKNGHIDGSEWRFLKTPGLGYFDEDFR